MANDRYTADFLSVNGSALAGAIEQKSAPGIQTIRVKTDGQVYSKVGVVPSVRPVFSFATQDIAAGTALALLTPIALSGTGLVAYSRKITNAVRSTTGIKASGATGSLIPRSLRASQGQPASASYEVWFHDSSGAKVFDYEDTTDALPTASAVVPYTVGQVKIDSQLFTGVQDISIDTGISAGWVQGDGLSYPTGCISEDILPTITFQTLDTSAAADLTADPDETTSFAVFFRLMAQGGVAVANATTSHLKISGTASVRHVSGVDHATGLVTVILEPKFDGTNAVVVRTAGVAIA